MKTEPSNKILKITLLGRYTENIAPENISTIDLYHLNFNLWGTLIDKDRNPSLAKLTYISPDNKTYAFELLDSAKFSNGRSIVADDVKSSFERMIAKEENGHANAKGIIEQIRVKSPKEIEIVLKNATPSFLYLLSTSELAVLPKESYDDKTLNIKTLSITSGAYSLEKFDPSAQIIRLKKNIHYPDQKSDSADFVEVSFDTSIGDNPDKLSSANSMFYEIYSSGANAIVKSLNISEGPLKYSITRPSLSVFLIQEKNHSSLKKGKHFSYLVNKYFEYETEMEKKSFQFLPTRTFGSLANTEIPSLADGEKIDSITLRIGNPNTPLIVSLKKQLEEKAKIKVNIIDVNSKEPADFIGGNQGMNLDYPEIELYLRGLSPYANLPLSVKAKELTEKAFHESDAKKRSELIKAVGKDILEESTIVPLTLRSYLHVYDSRKIDISNIASYDGDIPFWKIRML